MQATFSKYSLKFKTPGSTSRGILTTKDTYFLKIFNNEQFGIGECGLFKGLSVDDVPGYEEKLTWTCKEINQNQDVLLDELTKFPSIQFGLEQAFLSINNYDTHKIFPSNFTNGEDSIPINGLIWMGDERFMRKQISEKLSKGYSTIKLKIGAINFDTELRLLKSIREEYSSNDIELRVDANGAFDHKTALEKLKRLSNFDLHSIEQPIKPGQWEEMANLCAESPLDIALDEELIGIFNKNDKEKLLNLIQPQYIILKPSLIGGIQGSMEWIIAAEKAQAKWWITSALESNIGLNAIAQFTYSLNTEIPQGLGTGKLFTNNIKSPLKIENGKLHYSNKIQWGNVDSLFSE